MRLNVFMIVVSQWPPDITPQQRVWIQTLTYKQDIVDVSLRMFSEDRKYECWWAAELISHSLSLSAWVHGLANGQRGAGLLVMRINSDSAQLYLCLVVCVFVGWFSGSSFCVSPFCDGNKVKIKLKMADPLHLKMADPLHLKMADPLLLKMADPLLLKTADPLLLKMAAPLYLKMADSFHLGGFHWALQDTEHRVMKFKPVYCGCWSPRHMKMVINAAI